MSTRTLTLLVRTRQEVIFEGSVLSITSYNEKGRFDILPGHSRFISLIKTGLTARLPDGGEKSFQVSEGVLRVDGDKVEIYLGIKQTVASS